uniref:Uncharacterized protein n=1 Tax=Arundo donax TaxID=35708 RepID=A0A0A9BLX9_ARUDO
MANILYEQDSRGFSKTNQKKLFEITYCLVTIRYIVGYHSCGVAYYKFIIIQICHIMSSHRLNGLRCLQITIHTNNNQCLLWDGAKQN